MCVGVSVCVCMRARVHAERGMEWEEKEGGRVCVCVRACVRALLRLVKGVCVFRCNLPPALLAE